jgi:RNA polymerase sigma-70 factor (ECF subfamily)
MGSDPDAELMLGFQAGDQGAFRRLFDRHKGRVIHFCYRFCGQPALAEELAQETFLRVYQAADRYRPRARFQTWLFKIATNVCLNEMRRSHYQRRFETLEEAHESEIGRSETGGTPIADRPDERLEQKEWQTMVRRAIAQLPAEQRAALLLRVEQDFSYRQIGSQLGRSENHVKTLIHRGRQKLKQALTHYFGDMETDRD